VGKPGYREKNPNWRGGRSLASNGYVLVRVGRSHHLSDVRGYAYEHRIVAEKKIGRRLLPYEQVHHVDHDKANNDPSNLEVTEDVAHHRLEHRTGDVERLQMPDEPNRMILCGCGCGEEFSMFDDGGRPRRFRPGHNGHPALQETAILHALAAGPVDRHTIAARLGKPIRIVAVTLSKLKRKGLITNVDQGTWAIGRRSDV
jgi:hypothetical protein